ncbi:hypothetical protein Tco_1438847 [Tanacetum coccineum]
MESLQISFQRGFDAWLCTMVIDVGGLGYLRTCLKINIAKATSWALKVDNGKVSRATSKSDVSAGGIQILESLRSKFFNGHEEVRVKKLRGSMEEGTGA